jgi:hypothetical protein
MYGKRLRDHAKLGGVRTQNKVNVVGIQGKLDQVGTVKAPALADGLCYGKRLWFQKKTRPSRRSDALKSHVSLAAVWERKLGARAEGGFVRHHTNEAREHIRKGQKSVENLYGLLKQADPLIERANDIGSTVRKGIHYRGGRPGQ